MSLPDYTQDLNTQLQSAIVMGLTGTLQQKASAKEWITHYIQENTPHIVQLLASEGAIDNKAWPSVYEMGAALDWRKHLDMQRSLEELRLEKGMLEARLNQVKQALSAYEGPTEEKEETPNAASHPLFAKPSFLQPRLSREALLASLRKRINTSYMPSATGEVEFNSKPEYPDAHDHYLFRRDGSIFTTSGRLHRVGQLWRNVTIEGKKEEIMLWLHGDVIHFLIKLTSLEIWIGMPGAKPRPTEWILWPEGSTETLAINWSALEIQIENYL